MNPCCFAIFAYFTPLGSLKHQLERMSVKVLLLNQNYEPLTVCSMEKAVVLLYLGKAEMVEQARGCYVRAVSQRLPMPSVVRLGTFVRVPYRVILSRKNILRRDGFRCQYCGNTSTPLTIDHIIPRSRKGDDTWENLVAACIYCNNRKGNRTPDEARMPLAHRPMRPNHVFFIRHLMSTSDDGWKPYLYMH
jgi:5-methylcytosine-specific restriction endonuclease McrA